MGPIERELRGAGPSVGECVFSWHTASKTTKNHIAEALASFTRVYRGVTIYPESELLRVFPDLWSEAIEAAEALGL